MGNIRTSIDIIRLRTRDKLRGQLSDSDIVALIDSVLRNINDALRGLESVLVIQKDATIQLVSGEGTVTPTFTHDGLIWDFVYIDLIKLGLTVQGEKLVNEGRPRYYHMSGQDVVFSPVPNDDYVVTCDYWIPAPSITGANLDNDDLPWGTLWVEAIQRSATVEGLQIRERNITVPAILATQAWEHAMTKSLEQGAIKRSLRGMYDYV